MAYSPVETTAAGDESARRNVVVPFPFLLREHVHVYLNGVEVAATGFVWSSDGLIVLNTAPEAGTVRRVERITPSDEPLVVFGVGPMDANLLNTANTQSFYIAQELTSDTTHAVATSEEALLVASEAEDIAEHALATSETASEHADVALDTSATANSTAASAVQIANAAVNTASAAQTAAESAAAAAQDAAASVSVHTASDLRYDSTVSGLGAGDVQAAIDLIAGVSGIGNLTSDTVANASTVSGTTVSDALEVLDSAKAASSHGHELSEVAGLQVALNSKLDASAYTGSNILTKLKTVDGSDSGLDADVVRGTAPSTYGLARLADANQAAARTALGLGSAAYNNNESFAAAAHNHEAAYLASWFGYWPVQTGRLAHAGDRDVGATYGGWDEPWNGAVITGVFCIDHGYGTVVHAVRSRYMQLYSPAGWWTIGYA